MAITLTKSWQKLAESHLGSISGYDDCYLRLYGKYNSQNTANNTTNYTLQLRVYNSGSWAQSGNCYAWITGTNYQNNTTLRFNNGETTIAEKTSDIAHESNGEKYTYEGGAFKCYAFNQTSADAGFYLPTINRYPSFTSNPTITGRTETTISFNYGSVNIQSDIYYSLDNSNWVHVEHQNTTISNLSPGTGYTIYVQARNHFAQSLTTTRSVNASTYGSPVQSVSSKTETSITMNWSVDTAVSKVEYSKDNGSTWTTAASNLNATSGSYSISELKSNTTYNVKTRVTRIATGTTPSSSTIAVGTYAYPYVSKINTNNLVIGSSQTATIYNPLKRKVNVYMYQSDTGIQFYSGTTSATSITFTPDATKMYNSIPNSKTGKCYYYCVYANQIVNYTYGNYQIRGDEAPVISDSKWGYYVINSISTDLTADNKTLINSVSNVTVSIEEVGISTKNASSISYISATIGNKTVALSKYQEVFKGTINSVDSATIFLTVTDSRGLSTKSTKVTPWVNHTTPVIKDVSVSRENGIGTKVLFDFNGTYWQGNFGATDNAFRNAYYKYKEHNGTGNYSDWILITNYIEASEGKVNEKTDAFLPLSNEKNTTPNEFQVGKSYDIQFSLADKTEPTKYAYSSILTIGGGIPCTDKMKNSDATYSIGVNCLADRDYAFKVDGNIAANNYDGKWAGIENDYKTANSTDTWVPVFNNDKLQHRIINTNVNTHYNSYTSNLNNATTTGWYYFTKESSNRPAKGAPWGALVVQNCPSNGWVFQTAYGTYNADNTRIAHRGYINNVWTDWAYMPTGNRRTLLYSNDNGSNGTITLSSSAANFSYIEIYYKTTGVTGGPHYKSVRINAPNGRNVSLFNTVQDTGQGVMYTKSKIMTISGTSIAAASATYSASGAWNSYSGYSKGTSDIYITLVIGIAN